MVSEHKHLQLHEHHEHIHHLKKHRNVLYAIVVVLLVLQIATFVSLSSQVSKVNAGLERTRAEQQQSAQTLEKKLQETSETSQAALELYKTETRQNVQEITKTLSRQQSDFDKQIALLKAEREDFSGIIGDAVKGVVSVGTDKGSGTGFLISGDGYLLTNHHVIANAQQIAILTYDKKIVSAKTIGSDGTRDVALLKAEGNYHALQLANSDELQVGKKVVAIGNPLGLSFSVTEGIISALHRRGPNGLEEYVQTDVSLNPGNSGGPLIDTSGKVIGIANFKVGGAESLGFALESNAVRVVVKKIANESVRV